ncbi:hypothetical protein ACQRCB_09145, partial [Streptococcus hyointestinalis]|uniref:hypothetical protein n=2 Tax=Streptococcus TaxID=1301 RepID=UPI003D03C212
DKLMSKTRGELAVDITISLHEELYKSYAQKCNHDHTYQQEFGEYVGEQFQHILNALKTEN